MNLEAYIKINQNKKHQLVLFLCYNYDIKCFFHRAWGGGEVPPPLDQIFPPKILIPKPLFGNKIKPHDASSIVFI